MPTRHVHGLMDGKDSRLAASSAGFGDRRSRSARVGPPEEATGSSSKTSRGAPSATSNQDDRIVECLSSHDLDPIADSTGDRRGRVQSAPACDVRRPGDSPGGVVVFDEPAQDTGGFAAERMHGKEPAVNGRGLLTTGTFMKLRGGRDFYVFVLAFTCLKIPFNRGIVLIFASYYLWNTWDPINGDGTPCAYHDEDLCATETAVKVFLTISRVTAGAVVPCMAFCIMSKFYATRYFLHHSWLSYFITFEPAHQVHTFFGVATVVLATIHAAGHMARIVHTRYLPHIWSTSRDRAGIIAFIFLILSTVPMVWGFLKRKFTFETRKAVHMLSLAFIVAVCFHTPYMGILYGLLFTWYLVDRLYFTTRMIFKIDHATFTPVGRGTFVRFDLPDGYVFKVGSYIQVSCPAISTSEWHPFSIFPVKGSRLQGGFHAEAVGDWTEELFRLSLQRPRMVMWITSAQPSVIEESAYFDHLLLVCTGTGITPAICTAQMYEKRKDIHLVWLSRDASMVAMFEEQLRHVKSTVHITGRQTDETKTALTDLFATSGTEASVKPPQDCCASTTASQREAALAMLEAGTLGKGEIVGSCAGLQHVDTDGSSASFASPTISSPSETSVMEHHIDGQLAQAVGAQDADSAHPVTISFGRLDVKGFVTDTIRSHAPTPECRNREHASISLGQDLPMDTEQGPARLDLQQAIWKRNLMSADEAVAARATTRARGQDGRSFPNFASRGEAGKHGKWLVLFCGGNRGVEKSVAEACEELKVTWRKEYFSAW